MEGGIQPSLARRRNRRDSSGPLDARENQGHIQFLAFANDCQTDLVAGMIVPEGPLDIKSVGNLCVAHGQDHIAIFEVHGMRHGNLPRRRVDGRRFRQESFPRRTGHD